MASQMVRKQIYIYKRQDALLKRLAEARGLSEAEIIRQAIDHEVAGEQAQNLPDDQDAWQAMQRFIDLARFRAGTGEPYVWNRAEIYAERENRWLRDQEQD